MVEDIIALAFICGLISLVTGAMKCAVRGPPGVREWRRNESIGIMTEGLAWQQILALRCAKGSTTGR